MHARGCLIALFLFLCIGARAGATPVETGWDLEVPTTIVFIGDDINISVAGPSLNVTVEIRLTDPNGTPARSFFALLDNGTATWNYTTTGDDFPGLWRVSALVNGREVAFGEVTLLFDELNFLSKRQLLLEKRMNQQDGIVANLLDDNKQLHSLIDLMRIFVPLWIIAGSFIYYWAARHSWTMARFLTELEKLMGPGAKFEWWYRFKIWLLAPYGASELEQFHHIMRQKPGPKWPAEAIARRCVATNKELGIPERPLPRPVKKIRVIVKKGAPP
jgi:hypothetical protein